MRLHRVMFLGFLVTGIFFSAVDLSALWQSKRLTYNAGASYAPAIALDGSNVYVVWSDDTPGNNEIYFKKSATGGIAWTSAKRLTYTPSFSIPPAIAVNGSNIYVVWGEYDNVTLGDDVYFKKSVDGGSTWQASKRLTYTSEDNYYPYLGVAIAVAGSNLYLAWHDDSPGNNEIYFRKSVDGGAHWQDVQRLTYNSGSSLDPAIVVKNTTVYLTWHDDTAGNGEVYFRKSNDGGATWQSVKRLTNNSSWSQAAAIAVSGANVYVTWHDGAPGNNEIYLRKSTDGGANWQTAKRLTFTAGQSDCPSLGVNGSIVFVTWYDDTPGNNEIYFVSSGDGGSSWQAVQRLTYTSGWSGNPALAINSSMVCIVYEDLTPGNDEIFWKSSSGSF
jgi:BNR repeat-like domain